MDEDDGNATEEEGNSNVEVGKMEEGIGGGSIVIRFGDEGPWYCLGAILSDSIAWISRARFPLLSPVSMVLLGRNVLSPVTSFDMAFELKNVAVAVAAEVVMGRSKALPESMTTFEAGVEIGNRSLSPFPSMFTRL